MAADSEIREWARRRGQDVPGRGRVPAGLRAEFEAAHGNGRAAGFPPPGSDFEKLAAESEPFDRMIDVEDSPSVRPPGAPTVGTGGGPPGGGPPGDEPPPHSRREWRQKPRPGKPKPAPKVTAGIHGDIHAKIMFVATAAGSVWQARDPICGGTFVQQIPATAGALTDIICASADLVAFMTGPAGGFMKYLELGAALLPVGQAIMAHHVYHTVELTPDGMMGRPEPVPYAA